MCSLYTLYSRHHENAMFKRTTSGSAGYDMCAVEIKEKHGCVYANTGVRVAIPPGYVGKLHERSSLHQRGYELKNSVGIIDSDYRGLIYAVLRKTRKDAEPLDSDKAIVQLIIEPILSETKEIEDVLDCEEVYTPRNNENCESKPRNEGCFGSTDN